QLLCARYLITDPYSGGLHSLSLHDALPICLPFVAAIVAKELREARRNRTLLLVVLLPLMASVAFSWLQSEGLARITVGVPASHRDRKSTRLNSSHVKISYAVFCLKKKKAHV